MANTSTPKLIRKYILNLYVIFSSQLVKLRQYFATNFLTLQNGKKHENCSYTSTVHKSVRLCPIQVG